MRFKSFFAVIFLQLTAAFAISVKIFQEIFLANAHFLSGVEVMPVFLIIISTAFLGLCKFFNRFSEQRFYLVLTAFIGTLSVFFVYSGAGLFSWVLLLVVFAFLIMLGIESVLACSYKCFSIIFIILNSILIPVLQIDLHVFTVTRAHLNLKILTVVSQDSVLLAKAAKNAGVESRMILWELVFLIILPLIVGSLIGRLQPNSRMHAFRARAVLVPLILIIVHYNVFEVITRNTSVQEYMGLRISAGAIPLPLHPDLKNNKKLLKVISKNVLLNTQKSYCPAKISWQPANYEKIVFFIIESLRFDSYVQLMKKTAKQAKSGKSFNLHHSSSNTTHGSCHALINANLPVNLFFSDQKNKMSVFEKVAIENGFSTVLVQADVSGVPVHWGQRRIVEEIKEAWQTTPAVLQRTLEELNKPGREIIISYLFNTHFNYFYPSEFQYYKPVCKSDENIFMMQPTKENNQKIRNRYKNSVLFLDACIDEFLNIAKENGLAEKTLFIFFGDHGQSLRETGSLGHGTGADILQYRVPFLVIGKHISAEVVNEPTSHINILSEVLAPAGFNIQGAFNEQNRKYPVLALEESVSGRILVIEKNYMNIFDTDSGGRIRWTALVNKNYTLDKEFIQSWYENSDLLAETIAKDFNFIKTNIGQD